MSNENRVPPAFGGNDLEPSCPQQADKPHRKRPYVAT